MLLDIVGYTIDHSHDDRYARHEAGVKHASGAQTFALSATAGADRNIVMTPPAGDYAIVTASGFFFLEMVGYDQVQCTITNGPIANDPAHDFWADDFQVEAGRQFIPFSSTRVIPVAASATTFRLVCEEERQRHRSQQRTHRVVRADGILTIMHVNPRSRVPWSNGPARYRPIPSARYRVGDPPAEHGR